MTFFEIIRRQRVTLPRWPAILVVVALGSAVGIGLFGEQVPLLVIGTALAVPVAFAGLAWPDLPALATLFLLYTNAPVIAVRFHDVPSFVAAAAPVLLVIPLVSHVFFHREGLVINRVTGLLFLFLLIQIIGTLFSKDIGVSTRSLTTFVTEGIGLYLLIINTVRTPETLRRAIWTLLIAGALLGGLSVYQKVTGTYENNYGGFAQVSGVGFDTGVETVQGEVRQPRLTGPLGTHNYYAQIMLMLVPLGLSQFWGERSKILRALALAGTGLITIGALLTYSRGLAIGLAVVFVAMVLIRYIKPRQFIITLLGLLLVLQAVPEFGVRLGKTLPIGDVLSGESANVIAQTDTSTQGRLGEMGAAALVFLDHPIIGVGPGMFKYYYPDYVELVGLVLHAGTREAHDLYLDVAAETGAFGLLIFLAIVGVTLYELDRARRRWRQKRPELAHMAAGFFLAVVSYLVTGLLLSLAYERYFWMILALGGAVSYIANTAEEAAIEATGPGARKNTTPTTL